MKVLEPIKSKLKNKYSESEHPPFLKIGSGLVSLQIITKNFLLIIKRYLNNLWKLFFIIKTFVQKKMKMLYFYGKSNEDKEIKFLINKALIYSTQLKWRKVSSNSVNRFNSISLGFTKTFKLNKYCQKRIKLVDSSKTWLRNGLNFIGDFKKIFSIVKKNLN